jgi:hypothetical protein
MAKRPHNRLVIGLMLLAAVATYADSPRLAGTLLIGGAANFIAARDSRTVAELQSRLRLLPADSEAAIRLAEQIDDGKRSVAIVEGMPSLPGVVAPQQCQSRIEPTSRPPRIASGAQTVTISRLSGLIASLSKPPPASPGQIPVPGPVISRRLSERGPPARA